MVTSKLDQNIPQIKAYWWAANYIIEEHFFLQISKFRIIGYVYKLRMNSQIQ